MRTSWTKNGIIYFLCIKFEFIGESGRRTISTPLSLEGDLIGHRALTFGIQPFEHQRLPFHDSSWLELRGSFRVPHFQLVPCSLRCSDGCTCRMSVLTIAFVSRMCGLTKALYLLFIWFSVAHTNSVGLQKVFLIQYGVGHTILLSRMKVSNKNCVIGTTETKMADSRFRKSCETQLKDYREL